MRRSRIVCSPEVVAAMVQIIRTFGK